MPVFALFFDIFFPGMSGPRSVISVGNMSEHTTLLHDEAESFALEPVDASAIRGQVRVAFEVLGDKSFCWRLSFVGICAAFQWMLLISISSLHPFSKRLSFFGHPLNVLYRSCRLVSSDGLGLKGPKFIPGNPPKEPVVLKICSTSSWSEKSVASL